MEVSWTALEPSGLASHISPLPERSETKAIRRPSGERTASDANGKDPLEFDAVVRIDTPQEALYYANGGILQYVLRQLLASKPQTVGA